jgi:hypothetical protein
VEPNGTLLWDLCFCWLIAIFANKLTVDVHLIAKPSFSQVDIDQRVLIVNNRFVGYC